MGLCFFSTDRLNGSSNGILLAISCPTLHQPQKGLVRLRAMGSDLPGSGNRGTVIPLSSRHERPLIKRYSLHSGTRGMLAGRRFQGYSVPDLRPQRPDPFSRILPIVPNCHGVHMTFRRSFGPERRRGQLLIQNHYIGNAGTGTFLIPAFPMISSVDQGMTLNLLTASVPPSSSRKWMV